VINGMKLNKFKCQILHVGWTNTRQKWKLGEEWLESSLAGRDLGMLIGIQLCRSQQCALTVQRANPILR